MLVLMIVNEIFFFLSVAEMFEAKILQGALLKKIIEAIRELVTDANLDCNERGITMQVKHDRCKLVLFAWLVLTHDTSLI
jgi:DNA polymerase III sliding clamp (beta) subunit (PCNA family)